MINKTSVIGNLASLGFLLGINSGQVVAQMTYEEMQPLNTELKNQFQRVQQPLWLKGVVTAGGLGLIGLELWWFFGIKTRSRKEEL